MADNTTKCPNCGARVWYAEDRLIMREVEGVTLRQMRCVCNEYFTPTELEEYRTGAQKRAEQDMRTEARPSKPRPAPRKKAKKGAK